MRFLSELGGPVPKAFHAAAELILNIDLHRAVSGDTIEAETIKNLVDTAASWKVDLDADGISYDLQENMEEMTASFAANPEDTDILQKITNCVVLAQGMPFNIDLWKVQNIYWEMLQNVLPEFRQKTGQNNQPAAEWVKNFLYLGEQLKIRTG
jgi:hypothetical protein